MMEQKIRRMFKKVEDMVVEKDKSYGSSYAHPIHIFYRGDSETSIRARLDEKLSRIKNNPDAFGENAILDLVGGLVYLLIILEDKRNHSKK